MYTYRKLNEQQKQDVVHYRKLQSLPLHSPPHFPEGAKTYIITAAIYEHKHIMSSEHRRFDFQEKLIDRISRIETSSIFAWSILPNHYHILLSADLIKIKTTLSQLHNGISTQWNREDNSPGRKVWHRFSDRHIRSEAHYWATINYIHYNPVKHVFASAPEEWKAGSFNIFEGNIGKEKMSLILQSYPVEKMGVGWDD